MDYRRVDRDQLFLLPPSMRDWLPADHLALLVEDVVGQMDTTVLHRRARLGGVGRSPYDPDLLFGLLVYAYADGVRSARRIETKCHTDIAYRYLCAQDVPDHSVIARFRRAHADVLTDLLTEVLVVAVRLGMGRFGHVAIDGTKIAANASREADRDVTALRQLAADWMNESIAVDDAEDTAPPERGDRMPPGMGEHTGRAARIRAALAKAETRQGETDAATAQLQADLAADLTAAQTRLDTARAHQQTRLDDYDRQKALPLAQRSQVLQRRPGPVDTCAPVLAAAKALTKCRRRAEHHTETAAGQRPARVNLTDPDARWIPIRGGSFLLGYNSQTAVSDDHLILAIDTHDNPSDTGAFTPTMNKAVQTVAAIGQRTGTTHLPLTIGLITADAGYDSNTNLTAPGPDRLIAQTSRRNTPPTEPTPPTQEGTARQSMARRLATPEGKTAYKRRAATVEPVNGHLKDRIGLRQFLLRGHTGARIELTLAAIAHNIRRIHSNLHTPTPQPA